MVISGGDFKPDALKPKEMVSLLLDDEEMETRCEWFLKSSACVSEGKLYDSLVSKFFFPIFPRWV